MNNRMVVFGSGPKYVCMEVIYGVSEKNAPNLKQYSSKL